MHGNFSESTRRVLQTATEIAREHYHEEVEPEDLLLALLDDPDATVCEGIDECRDEGVSAEGLAEQIRASLRARMIPGAGFPARGKLPLSLMSQRALRLAAEIASPDQVEPGDLLVGLSRMKKSVAAEVLLEHGVQFAPAKDEQLSGTDGATAMEITAAEPHHVNGTHNGLVEQLIEIEGETPVSEPPEDVRLYVPRSEGWQAHVKRTWEKEFCYRKHPGEDFFHLLMAGEIYLQHGDEKYCLTCALRLGLITGDRLYWQRPMQDATRSNG